jgi:small subunit ribosomal protein S16
MAVKIKLQRRGRTKKPVYRIVVQDSRTARDGKVIDIIGKYNPLEEPMFLELQEEKVKKWLGNGAQPTDKVSKLLASKGYLKAKDYPKKEEIKKEVEETVSEASEEVKETENI